MDGDITVNFNNLSEDEKYVLSELIGKIKQYNTINVTKLPDNLDPNRVLYEEVMRRNSKCPFCGETEGFKLFPNRKGVDVLIADHYRYGVQKPFWEHLFDKSVWWRKIRFHCYSCGAKWESDEFPEIKIKGVRKRS